MISYRHDLLIRPIEARQEERSLEGRQSDGCDIASVQSCTGDERTLVPFWYSETTTDVLLWLTSDTMYRGRSPSSVRNSTKKPPNCNEKRRQGGEMGVFISEFFSDGRRGCGVRVPQKRHRTT